jgi:F-type H+-transporting ATPase subunit epsilon
MATLPEAIELQIVTPQRHVLQATVQSVEIPGKEGYLGVLPGHAPLITELGVGILAYREGSENHFLTVINGYAEVLPDRVIVLAEISEKAEEIDVERSRAAQNRAQTELAKAGVGSDEWQREKLALDRALIRMQAVARTSGPLGGSQH